MTRIADYLDLVHQLPEVARTDHGRDKLAELTFEAWRLSAPTSLVTERADRLPS